MKTKMHFDASTRIFRNAKILRDNLTFAEKLLWSRIRNNQLGYHFRRQHPLSNYIADFYCHQLHLVIELDEKIHLDQHVKMDDQYKEESINSYGLHVIRFTNDEVIKNIDGVVESIKNTISILKEKGPL
jgi:imidazole glycerol-phosphate synthase subunit HisF